MGRFFSLNVAKANESFFVQGASVHLSVPEPPQWLQMDDISESVARKNLIVNLLINLANSQYSTVVTKCSTLLTPLLCFSLLNMKYE